MYYASWLFGVSNKFFQKILFLNMGSLMVLMMALVKGLKTVCLSVRYLVQRMDVLMVLTKEKMMDFRTEIDLDCCLASRTAFRCEKEKKMERKMVIVKDSSGKSI
jgi:hypothetical protein